MIRSDRHVGHVLKQLRYAFRSNLDTKFDHSVWGRHPGAPQQVVKTGRLGAGRRLRCLWRESEKRPVVWEFARQ